MEHKHAEEKPKLQRYQPLLVIFALLVLASAALNQAGLPWMESFMGLFFIIFAMFKFFDLRGFTDGFITYDLLAQKWIAYAYAYPFIELALGLAYLSGFHPTLTNLVTLLVMAVSAVGVLRGLMSGRDIQCACLGTTLNVPLSTVSLIENLGMGAMAALLLTGM